MIQKSPYLYFMLFLAMTYSQLDGMEQDSSPEVEDAWKEDLEIAVVGQALAHLSRTVNNKKKNREFKTLLKFYLNKKNLLTCEKCGYLGVSKKSLDLHKRSHPMFQCEYCLKSFVDELRFQDHIVIHEKEFSHE